MSYLDWNQRVFERVFNADRDGKTTSVYVDDEILYTWAREMGLKAFSQEEASKAFVQDCLTELRGDASTIADYCKDAALVWSRKKMSGAPDYMGMLALLVYASNWGEGTGHLFYGRYWKMTGDSRSGTIPHIIELRNCWKQLEQFSEKMEWNLGIYRLRTLAPSKVHVGIIVAQGVLRPSDEIALKDIFFDEGADPNVDYSDEHIRGWLDKPKSRLSQRAVRALASDENRDYVIARVREELEDWDGEPADWASQAGKSRTFKRAALLCFSRNSNGNAVGSIRLDISGRAGESETVTFGSDEKQFIAHSNGDSISTSIQESVSADLEADQATTKLVELSQPSDFQRYMQGEFRSTLAGNAYRYLINNSDVRVFVEGSAFGVSGYVESLGLRPSYRHIVVYRESAANDELRKWCRENTDNEVDTKRHVPAFFSDSVIWSATPIRANAPEFTSARFACLHYEIRPLARLTGGLKLYKKGNIYLKGAAPSITVSSTNRVMCSINGADAFEVDGATIHLEGRNLDGSIQLRLTEDAKDGKESEINLKIVASSEWSKEGDGALMEV